MTPALAYSSRTPATILYWNARRLGCRWYLCHWSSANIGCIGPPVAPIWSLPLSRSFYFERCTSPNQNGNAQRGERLHMGLTMDKFELTNNDSMVLSELMQKILDDKRWADYGLHESATLLIAATPLPPPAWLTPIPIPWFHPSTHSTTPFVDHKNPAFTSSPEIGTRPKCISYSIFVWM